MTLAEFVEDVADRRKTIVVHSDGEGSDVEEHFETRNVTVERESIAPDGPDGFVVLRDEDEFVGAFPLGHLATLLAPPLFRPWRPDDASEPWAALYEVLDDTPFASFDRRQVLAATREIENRAWRVGTGSLRVGFQSAAAFGDQAEVYERMAAESDLSIKVYLGDEADVPSHDGVEVFHAPDTEVGDYWFLAFDAAGDPTNACGLVAEERSPGSYFGFWTYDRERVEALATYLRETYEDEP